MKKVLLKDVKKNVPFRFHDDSNAATWQKDSYDRSFKAYWCYPLDDMTKSFLYDSNVFVYVK